MSQKATLTERSRAFRLRKAVRDGGELADPDRAWLDAYNAGGERRGVGVGALQSPRVATVPAFFEGEEDALPAAEGVPSSSSSSAPPSSSSSSSSPAGELVPIFVAPDEPGEGSAEDDGTHTDAPRCPIKDCPACRAAVGAQTCGVTGKLVWPPMSEDGAEALAGVIFAVLGLALRFFRPDRRIVAPTADERKQLGRALREVALRRASWIGAFDDLLAAGWALSRYSVRALREPTPKPEALSAGS